MKFSELVSRPELDITVLVAAAGAANRTVSGAYITDLPDPSRFVSVDEVVLTSGLWVQKPGGAQQFLSALQEQHVTALIVGLIEIGQVPDGVIALCREKNLTVATIGGGVSFKTISDAIEREQTGSSSAVVARAADFARRVTDLLARGDGALAALRLFADEFHQSAWIVDDAGTVIASVGTPPGRLQVAAVWNAMVDAALGDSGALEGGGAAVAHAEASRVVEDGDGHPVSVWSLAATQHRAAGYLVCAGDRDGFAAELRAALDALAGALRVELELSSRWRDARQSRVAELVQLVIDDSVSPGEIATRMRLEGLDAQLPTSVVVAEVVGRAFVPAAAFEIVSRLFSTPGSQVIGCVLEGRVVVLVNGPGDDDVAERVTGVEVPLLAGRQLRIGVSDAVAGVSQLGSGLAVARERLEAATGTGAVVVSNASGIRSHRALIRMLGERTRTAFAADVLRPLIEYDAKHGAAFVETVRVFLDTGGAWQEAARRLHLHPNTLRYRIARIEELTERNLSTMDDRVDLYLALDCLGG